MIVLTAKVRAVCRIALQLTMGLVLLAIAQSPLHAQSFGASELSGVSVTNPTSLQFGPDDRLYVAQQDGLITVVDIVRIGPNNYGVTGTETITLIQSIPNHNDNGQPNPTVNTRQVTGLLVSGTSSNPVLYVTSSDPRITAGNTEPPALTLDTNSGILSRLSWSGSTWVKLDLVRGLPRSEENHASNGMALDPSTNTLYMMSGGHTNSGAPSSVFGLLPEYALSAALLSIDLDAIGNTTYDLPTLDDEDRAGSEDVNDPFGGNGGKNQAIIDPGGPVQVFSPGWRNAYDVVLTTQGNLYTVDNGANGNFGAPPDPNTCSNQLENGGPSFLDALHFISQEGYYGGHPNPTRGNQANTWNVTNPQSPVPFSNPVECSHFPPSSNGSLAEFPSSTNGITEYTASNFGGVLSGNLVVVSFGGVISRLQLNAAGDDLVAPPSSLFSGVNAIPLDVVAQGDGDLFPGTVWVVDYAESVVSVFEPDDFDGGGPSECQGTDSSLLDEDLDGYTNSDEIDNDTNPCSAGSIPADFDADFVSDLNDPNDDNDGLLDNQDPFALDPSNGAGTNLPVTLTWNNGEPPRGGLLDLGFTGLMTNGVDYSQLFDADVIIPGGAPGVYAVLEVPAGDAFEGLDSQQFGMQFGINVGSDSPPFTAQVQLIAPFQPALEAESATGLFFGTGDQNNYIEVSAVANGGVGGIEVGVEVNGVHSSTLFGPGQGVSISSADKVQVSLQIDPQTASAQPMIQIDSQPSLTLGNPISFPVSWLLGVTRPAVGVLATSRGAPAPFVATWDDLFVFEHPVGEPENVLYRVNAGGPQVSATDGGLPWEADTQFNPSIYNNSAVAGNHVSSVGSAISLAHPSIPAGTPPVILQSERWDQPTGAEMSWSFPVAPGSYEVRLYFAETIYGNPGQRVADVLVEGALLANDLDVISEVGMNAGIVLSDVVVVGDGALTVDFVHVVENPMIKAIEVISQSGGGGGNQAPVLTGPAPQVGTVGDGVSLLLQAQDPDGDPLTWSASGLPPSLTLNAGTGLISGTLSVAGTFNPTVTASDGEASDSASFAFTVNSVPPPGGATVLYRVNAGGPEVSATDGGLPWEADTQPNPSIYNNSAVAGNHVSSVGSAISLAHPSIPAGTPPVILQSERWDQPTGAEMSWSFPVAPGSYEVRLYFAETIYGNPGQRVADVLVEGALLANDLDVISEVGMNAGIVLTDVVAVDDGAVTVDFVHVVENPMIKAIEVIAQSGGGGGNQAPVLTEPADQVGTVGDGVSLLLQAQDPDGDPLTWSASGLPPSLTLNASTGLISGTLSVAGTFNPTVTASDGEASDSASFAFTVNSVPPPGGATVLYRVNAGGPEVSAADGGLPWEADTQSNPSIYNNSAVAGNHVSSVGSAISLAHPSIPAGTPPMILQSERWDKPTGAEMSWSFPVASGTYEVRLYFAETIYGNSGQRVADVLVEGALLANDLDVISEVGMNAGIVLSDVVAVDDGAVTVDFVHVVENPMVKAIEVLSSE